MKIRNISLCLEDKRHKNFLIRLFKESHEELNLITNINEEEKEKIIYSQFIMEQQQLRQAYPEAKLNIIICNNEPIGKLYINYGYKEERILEIGILKKFRRQGICKKIVTKVIEEALVKEKAVSLQVAWFNVVAYNFYENLGFKVIEDKGAFYEMKYIR
ncbi:Acetyltransferase (GNAT) family protein [Clostridium cavendishii DSM 21758]|uniref:Acetyltransferase (GNAT) family protein n=1 Tax=Clostridium cavendishii DSM 21758 TaxID=1121302 RepID=A0A1M6T5G3_9CLOT|nr:GNAT family N-acetyltransferase [Clostridium cavendishii]SHK52194.1 Acetyltransferase (GNAT) family protein [Clostridium cavendishii DSM 21758]